MILLVGASASGKTEVAKCLSALFGISKVITHTTREKRVSEVEGVDYFFVTKEEFLALKEKNFFVETTLYNDNYYGTSKAQIGDNKVLIVDPNGLKAFNSLKDNHIITFFMSADEDTRMKRMLSRGDKEENAKERIALDRIQFSYSNIGKTDFVIETEDISIEEAATEVYKKYIDKMGKLTK